MTSKIMVVKKAIGSRILSNLLLFLIMATAVSANSTNEQRSTAPTSTGYPLTTSDVRDDASSADDVKRERHSFRLGAARLRKYLMSLAVGQEIILPAGPSDNFTVKVTGTISVNLVNEVNDAKQTLKSTFFITVSWTDDAFTWNASEYNDVNEMKLPHDAIWMPAIFTFTDQGIYSLLDHDSNAFALLKGSSGVFTSMTSFTVTTPCAMDLSRFPYDTQNCIVMILSQSNVALSLNTTQDDNPVYALVKSSSEWDILNVATLQVMNGDVVEGVEVVLELRRRTTFYTVCLVLPMVLTSYMNTLVFLLPLQSGEKVSFLVTLFVSTSVFVGFFCEMMPRGLDSVPSTMKLLVGVIVQSLLVLLATILVLRRHQHEGTKSPWQEKTEAKSDHTSESDSRIGCCLCARSRAIHVQPKVPDEDVMQRVDSGARVPAAKMAVSFARRGKFWGQLTSSQLDRFLFYLAFLSNSIFLVAVFLQA